MRNRISNVVLFLVEFRRALGFGTLCSFLSGFGQTYFVSLFVPSVCERMGIHPGDFGPMYAGATLCSGLLLSRVGRHGDQHGERAIFYPAGLMLALGMVLLSQAETLWWALPAVFAMRFGGQGSLGLLSGATMARYFVKRRGLALSLASLGYPGGEILLPGLVVALNEQIGWDRTLPLFALALLSAVLLTGTTLLRAPLRGDVPEEPNEDKQLPVPRFRWHRDPIFLLLMVATGLPGAFTGTILFLYQLPVAEMKGWSAAWMATCFSVFALTRAGISLLSGPMIDRWSGERIFPLMVLPTPFAVAVLRFAQVPMGAMLYYVLLGSAFGMGGALTAFLAERYGRNIIGQVRGAGSAFMVVFSALGPFSAGILLRQGWSYVQLMDALIVLALVCCPATLVAIWLHRRLPARQG